MKTSLQRHSTSGFSIPRTVLLLAASLWLGLAMTYAGQPGIDDSAGFFSDKAKSQALRTMAEIKQQFHEDFFVATFKTLPDDVKQGVNLQDKAALNQAVEKWTIREAKKRSVPSIFVLIVKDPGHLQAVVGNETIRQAFTAQNRDSLAKIMTDKLHNKQPDEALADGANFVFSTLKEHAPHHAAATGNFGNHTTSTNQSSGHPLLWLIGGIIGIWLIVRLIGSMMGAGRSNVMGAPPMAGGMPPQMPGYSSYPQQGGGGGFMRSMLGGMFGSAAGMWLYDRFSGGEHHSSGWGGGDSGYNGGGGYSDGGSSAYSNNDTDYSGSSGGSFGDDSGSSGGGGDWGSGGGDSGGGDSGGGGDF